MINTSKLYRIGSRPAKLASAKYGKRKIDNAAHNTLRLEVLRKALGMRQRDVAEEVGVTIQAVSQWEAGVKIPTDKHKIALCKVLGCTITELIDWRE